MGQVHSMNTRCRLLSLSSEARSLTGGLERASEERLSNLHQVFIECTCPIYVHGLILKTRDTLFMFIRIKRFIEDMQHDWTFIGCG